MMPVGPARAIRDGGGLYPSKPLIGGERMEQQRIFRGYIDFLDQLIDECERATLEYDLAIIQELFQ